MLTRYTFGETIFLNIVEILTDIYSEVTWQTRNGIETELFRAWRQFVNANGQRILVQLYDRKGYAVIAWKKRAGGFVFWQMQKDEYIERVLEDEVIIEPYDDDCQYYILKSPTYEATGKSDKTLCTPYIKYLDNVLNGSNTISERLGTFIVASPETPSNAPTAVSLSARDKDALEKQLESEYGALSQQKQIMLLPNSMKFTTINLAGLDNHIEEKARLAILAICDRIKVPANQVAIIDAESSKSLSNGTELREGDMAKYRTFRRLLNATFYDMATEIGLQVDYTIENEPRSVQGQQIEQPQV